METYVLDVPNQVEDVVRSGENLKEQESIVVVSNEKGFVQAKIRVGFKKNTDCSQNAGLCLKKQLFLIKRRLFIEVIKHAFLNKEQGEPCMFKA